MCRGRAELYCFLAAVALAPPSQASVDALSDPGNRALLAESIGDPLLAGAFAGLEGGGGASLKELADEFHALFVVPGPKYCTPNESVFLEPRRGKGGNPAPGLLSGPRTLGVRAAYQRAGYLLEKGFGDLPDHIAAELLFMARLCDDEGEAHEGGRAQEAGTLAGLQADFLREHLAPFAPLLSARVAEATKQAYFRAWAALLRAFVCVEGEGARTQAGAP